MEWRIIVSVLCLIATTPIATAESAATNSTTSAASAATNSTVSPAPASPATAAPEKVEKIDLGFKILKDFKEVFANLSDPETKALSNSITSELSPVYSKRFPTFKAMTIKKFSKGSVVVDSVLEFASTNSSSVPNVSEVKNTLAEAIASGNLNVTVDNTSISATVTPETNATTSAAPAARNSTMSPAPASPATAAPEKVEKIDLVFRILKDFKEVFTNLNDPETKALSNSITSELSPVYRKRFPTFKAMTIKKFSKGSVVVDSVLEFASTNGSSVPNVSEVIKTLAEAITSGNLNMTVDNTSTSAAVTPEPNATTSAAPAARNSTMSPAPASPATAAPEKVEKIDLVFRILKDFKEVFANLNDPETKALSNSITSELSPVYRKRFPTFKAMTIKKFSKGSVVVDSVLEFASTNSSSVPNVSEVKNTLTEAITSGNLNMTVDNTSISAAVTPETNATTSAATTSAAPAATNSTVSPAPASPATAAPEKVEKIDLVFKILKDFKEVFTNLNDPETKALSNSITSELSPFYRKRFPTFKAMTIKKFSKGSVVVDSVLEFASTNSSSVPNVSEVKNTLTEAITSGNLNVTVDNTSISAAVTPETNATTSAAPAATNSTRSPAPASPATAAPEKVEKIDLVFKILKDFKEVFANLNDPETKALSNSITSELSPFYRKRFPKFKAMTIKKFSKGSVVVDSVLEFDSTNGSSVPNVSEVIKTLTEAITSGNLNVTVDNTSISAAVTPETNVTTAAASTSITTTTVSAASNLEEFKIAFKMNEVFSTELSNMASATAIKLATIVTTELNTFCKGFKNFNRSLVSRFSNGSIVVDGLLGFSKNTSNPNVKELARGLAEAVRNGTIKLTVDPKSINVTDSTGQTANRSPVLASMLTALWMTLASLLLSAVMH